MVPRADQPVPAAVVVVRVVVRAEPVLLGPVDLEVAGGIAVEAADERPGVRVFLQAPQVRAELVLAPRQLPEEGDAQLVHPGVEQARSRSMAIASKETVMSIAGSLRA